MPRVLWIPGRAGLVSVQVEIETASPVKPSEKPHEEATESKTQMNGSPFGAAIAGKAEFLCFDVVICSPHFVHPVGFGGPRSNVIGWFLKACATRLAPTILASTTAAIVVVYHKIRIGL